MSSETSSANGTDGTPPAQPSPGTTTPAAPADPAEGGSLAGDAQEGEADGRGEAEISESASAGECALAGCTEPLPARGRGRPAKYCSKAHADQASRDRRAADAAAVDEPLRQAEALAQRVPAAIDALQGQLAELQEFLATAQEGALSRVRRAEAEATAAAQAEADADVRALAAEKAREEAVAAAEAARAAQRADRKSVV